MTNFDFKGWDKDNGSSLNIVFGNFEELEKVSSNEFLSIFNIDELEDEGELQHFEYPDYIDFGKLQKKNSEIHFFNYDGNSELLENFIDRFNLDYIWHYSNGEFKLIHDNTIDGNLFSEASGNFVLSDSTSSFIITQVVAF